jgi:transcription antitermination factor NusG
LEVFLPLVSVRKVVNKKTVVASEPAAQGYIFLRVANADFDLVEAVREVKGVGGFLSPDVSSALDGIPQADVTRMLNMHNRSVDNVVTLRVDDEVEIVSGPLMHHTGRVAEITTDVITVSVSILGRLVDMAFSPVEVKSLK